VHRRDLDPDERSGVATSMLRTVVDCARELPLREAVVVADAALRAGLDPVCLRTAAALARGNGAANVREVVALADGRAESPIESCLRLVAGRLGQVVPQVWIDGVGRVDLLVDGWLVLEADGFEHHSDRAGYREDRRRGNALAVLGYTVLRFSYEDIVHREDVVAEVIARVLARGSR
jgi:very-short-patch-repair endonuclease